MHRLIKPLQLFRGPHRKMFALSASRRLYQSHKTKNNATLQLVSRPCAKTFLASFCAIPKSNSYATHQWTTPSPSENTPPTPPSGTPEPDFQPTYKDPLFVRQGGRTAGEVLAVWLLLILVSLIYSYPFGGRVEDALEEVSSDSGLSPEQRTSKLWRLLVFLGLAAAQLESRGGETNGRLAVRQAHPQLLPTLIRAAKADDPDERLAADAAIAWLFDAYSYTTAHAELGTMLSELYPYVSRDLLARNADHPELTDSRLPMGPWVLLLHMAMRDETRELFSEEIVHLVSKKAQQLAARDHRRYDDSWFIPTFMDQPVHFDSQLIHMIRSQMLLTPQLAQILNHPANAVTLHNLDSGLHFNSLTMSALGTIWDRTTVLEREFLTCSIAAIVWGAFRGARSNSVNTNVQGILRSMRMSRGTRSSRASGATASILGTSLFLLLSHTLAPPPQHDRSSTWPNARALTYWVSLLGIAAIPYTAVPAICALQAHVHMVTLPPRGFGPQRVRLN